MTQFPPVFSAVLQIQLLVKTHENAIIAKFSYNLCFAIEATKVTQMLGISY